MIKRTKPNYSKISEVDLMTLINVNVYGYTNVEKIKMVTDALYKEKGLIDQWTRGNKTAGVKARKVLQLLRIFIKEARLEISVENTKRYGENKEKYNKRKELKEEIYGNDN